MALLLDNPVIINIYIYIYDMIYDLIYDYITRILVASGKNAKNLVAKIMGGREHAKKIITIIIFIYA